MGKSNPDVIFLKNIENGNPVLVGRLHTNIVTVIFHKSVTQFLQPFWKEKRVCLYLIRLLVSVIQIQAKIHVLKDAKNFQLIYKDKTDIDGSSGKIESILEEMMSSSMLYMKNFSRKITSWIIRDKVFFQRFSFLFRELFGPINHIVTINI